MAKNITLGVGNDITIEQGFERFLRWCRLKGFSEYTIEFYDEIRMNFARFKTLDEPIEDINRELFEEYLLFLQKTNVSSVTIFIYAKGLKRVCNYFMDEDLIDSFAIELPKMEITVKEVYTEAELRKLLKKPNLKKCRFSEYRNWVIVNYLLGTGQRRNTVTNLKIGDVDLDNRLVRLRVTKGKKETILPLTASLVTILDEYLSYRGGERGDYLFCAQDGGKLSNSSLTNAIRKYNHRRGVEKSSVHLFRHTFAYMAMSNEMDVLKIQKLLCHARLDTTQNYLRQFGFTELQKDYEKYNPLEKLQSHSVAKEWSSKKRKQLTSKEKRITMKKD